MMVDNVIKIEPASFAFKYRGHALQVKYNPDLRLWWAHVALDPITITAPSRKAAIEAVKQFVDTMTDGGDNVA